MRRRSTPILSPSAFFRRHRRVVGGAGAARPLRDESSASRPAERDRLAAQFGGRRGLARRIPPARRAKLPARHPRRDAVEPDRPRRADALGRTLPSFKYKPLISFAGAVLVCLRGGRDAEQIEGAVLYAGGGGEDGGEAIAPSRTTLRVRVARSPSR